SWAFKNDYPSRALREKIGGTTSFRLTIGADGSISGCEITVSSGHTILDQATCRFLQKRARFTPAKDKYGKATIGKYEGYYQWVPWEPEPIHEDWDRLPFEMIDLQ
ncbi:MAG: energy transducer TonB, partial [Verrucomicrobiaceae bacterium]